LLGVVLLDQINAIQGRESTAVITEVGIFGGRNEVSGSISQC